MAALPSSRLLRRGRRLIVRVVRAWEAEVRARARRRPLWQDTVLYESFGGNGALDNPEAIFRALLDAPDQHHLRHIWVLRHGHARFREEFRGSSRVRIVTYRSSAYSRAISRARVLINNATFPPEFDKRPGQVYVNTWHGTPLKRMGYDMPDGAVQSANVLRNFVSADVLLSQSPWMTDRMYLRAYKLDGIFSGRILEAGYPRVDRQHLDAEQRRAIRARLGLSDTDQRRLVVYAPTWTGDSFSNPRDDAEALLASVTGLQHRVGPDVKVLLKAHQAVHHLLAAHPGRGDVLIDNDVPTNSVLGVTDHLITDFSSIFFDYLERDRPISFYVPDPGSYRDERGAYFDDDELPGAVVHDLAALAARILSPRDPMRARRQAWAERYTPHSDGHAAERVIDAVFREGRVRTTTGIDTRPRILIYLGGMRSNGITSSALNLLRALDHDAIDVSVLLAAPRGAQQRSNQALIDPRVRQFIRQGGMNGTKLSIARLKLRERLRLDPAEHRDTLRLYADEWHRLLGASRFDAVVDFSGYSRFWTQILLRAPHARRSIWLHNDMAAEVHRTIDGRRRMRRSLPAVFALYPQFDALVSVSPELALLNAANLAATLQIPRDEFLAARNLIDDARVRAGARVPLDDLPELREREDGGLARELDDPTLTWFINVGRLSPEKNQPRLLEAFRDVHQRHPRARLLLVGDGPERARLERMLEQLGIEQAVVLVGSVGNPFALMSRADCFVLSSDYEGQPMVLLEAGTLGMPIISTRFGSVDDALPAGSLTVVDPTSAALAAAMESFFAGEVRAARFEPEAYNRADIREAASAILGAADVESSSASSSTMAPTSASTITASQARAMSTTTAPAAIPIAHHMRTSDRA